MIAARAQLPPESSCFFLRRQLLSIITCYIKSEHPRYAYISLELIPTLSFTQLTPVRDGHRSPCLVASCADECKRPIYIHMHTPCATLDIYKKILSIFTSNKIQRYYNKKAYKGNMNIYGPLWTPTCICTVWTYFLTILYIFPFWFSPKKTLSLPISS